MSYLIFGLVYLTLSLADTHGIAKYAHTYIRETHTHAHTPKKIKVGRLEKTTSRKNKKKRGWVTTERKKKTRKDQKEKGGKEGGK